MLVGGNGNSKPCFSASHNRGPFFDCSAFHNQQTLSRTRKASATSIVRHGYALSFVGSSASPYGSTRSLVRPAQFVRVIISRRFRLCNGT
jgi:hypothetical protein